MRSRSTAVGQVDVDGAGRGFDVVDAGDRRVGQAHAQALVEAVDAEVGGDDRRQLGVVAVVEDLEELFLRPGRRVLRAEVVEDEHRRVAHLLEQHVVGHLAVRAVGGAQVVEEVGHDDEQRRLAALDAAVGDRGGDVGLAGAGGAVDEQPALRLFGEGAGVGDEARGTARGRAGWCCGRARSGWRRSGG